MPTIDQRQYLSKVQIRGPTEEQRMELDPIRSESPIGQGSGFIAAASAASANLLLNIPSGFVFLLKYIYAWGGTIGSIIFYDGGSVGSMNATIFAAFIPSSLSGPMEFHPWGTYVQSQLWASMGAVSTPAIKIGGYFFSTSAFD